MLCSIDFFSPYPLQMKGTNFQNCRHTCIPSHRTFPYSQSSGSASDSGLSKAQSIVLHIIPNIKGSLGPEIPEVEP